MGLCCSAEKAPSEKIVLNECSDDLDEEDTVVPLPAGNDETNQAASSMTPQHSDNNAIITKDDSTSQRDDKVNLEEVHTDDDAPPAETNEEHDKTGGGEESSSDSNEQEGKARQEETDGPMQEIMSDPFGAYLVYEDDNQGRFVIVWSKSLVANAVAFARPEDASMIKPYKLKSKDEISIRLQQSKKAYFNGWTAFVKQVRIFKSTIFMIPNPNMYKKLPPTRLVFHFGDNSTDSLNSADPPSHGIYSYDADAVAAVPASDHRLDGLSVLTQDVFLTKTRAITYADSITLMG